MTPVTEDIISEMKDIIVDAVNPLKIILFGSYARGQVHPDSDLDFLIVDEHPFGHGRNRRKQMTKLWKMLAHFSMPKDILIYSNDEVEHWRDAKNHIISRAFREGKVLYER